MRFLMLGSPAVVLDGGGFCFVGTACCGCVGVLFGVWWAGVPEGGYVVVVAV